MLSEEQRPDRGRGAKANTVTCQGTWPKERWRGDDTPHHRESGARLLPVSEHHSLVIHRESVVLHGAGGHAGPLPLHGEF